MVVKGKAASVTNTPSSALDRKWRIRSMRRCSVAVASADAPNALGTAELSAGLGTLGHTEEDG